VNNDDLKTLIKKARKLVKRCRVTGNRFRLKDFDLAAALGMTSEDKPRAKAALAMGVDALAKLDLKHAKVSAAKLTELAAAKPALLNGK